MAGRHAPESGAPCHGIIGILVNPALGPVDPKFQVEGIAPPTILLLRKQWLNDSFVWYKKSSLSFFRFVNSRV